VLTEGGHQALALLKQYIQAPEGVVLKYSVEIVDLPARNVLQWP